MLQSEAMGISFRIAKSSGHCSSKSAMILSTGGSSRSRSSSTGASIFAFTTSLKGPKSPTFSRSNTLGMVAKRMTLLLSFSLLGSEPQMQLSHSSVTTMVMRIPWPCFEDNDLQTPIMALIWPWHGKGIAATCRTVIDSIYFVGCKFLIIWLGVEFSF